MDEPTLFHYPGTCARMSMVALEHLGVPYRRVAVDVFSGEQHAASFVALNPMRKVPALHVGGRVVTESVAILTFLAAEHPDGGLFPQAHDALALAERYSGLSFCAANLHPLVRGVVNPARLTIGDGAPVREKALESATLAFDVAERRLAERGWWLGDRSIVDAYVIWAFDAISSRGLDAAPYPQLRARSSELTDWPAYAATMAIEAETLASKRIA